MILKKQILVLWAQQDCANPRGGWNSTLQDIKFLLLFIFVKK
jgi:hypothetical protein